MHIRIISLTCVFRKPVSSEVDLDWHLTPTIQNKHFKIMIKHNK